MMEPSTRLSAIAASLSAFLVSAALLSSMACGSLGAYDMRVFAELPLGEQISTYEGWARQGKLPRPQLSYLSLISRSGCNAAVAVVAEVEREGSAFPAADAVTVVDFARSSGCDVKALAGVMEWAATACDRSDDILLIIECADFHKHQPCPPRGDAGSE